MTERPQESFILAMCESLSFDFLAVLLLSLMVGVMSLGSICCGGFESGVGA
jgi:hypothetical protein